MMEQFVLHPLTRQQLEAFQASPHHAVQLIGPAGSGKASLAIELASALLETESSNFISYPYKMHVQPEAGKAIGVEKVRELEHFLSLKVPTSQQANRVIIFENAQLMTEEAQNALLKTLEEPPEKTIIILTVSQSQALLPTVISRLVSLQVHKPDKAALEEHFLGKRHGTERIAKAYAISGGLPGLMHALLESEVHPLLRATETARQLLRQSTFERLSQVDSLAKDKNYARNVCFILQQMAHAALQNANGIAARKWQLVLAHSYQANEALQQNASPKLALTNLLLHL